MNMERQAIESILEEVKKVIKGKDDIIEKVLTAILAKGHILVEDIPGVGKTTMALAFSKVLGLDQKRMQFTPDVLPTDVVGFNVLTKEHQFQYKPGAVLCNLFLADEINRTSSKTQSALLEVMEEGKVTVDGVTREVPKPFIVIATQNPVGSVGTQMLPESQLDRFIIKITMGYPEFHEEINILKGKQSQNPLDLIHKIIDKEHILEMQEAVEKVYTHDVLYNYMATLVGATRQHPFVTLGVSPRGSIALMKMSRANAFVQGRDYMIPEDIANVFQDVVAHRLVLSPKAKVSHIETEDVVKEIIERVKPPQL